MYTCISADVYANPFCSVYRPVCMRVKEEGLWMVSVSSLSGDCQAGLSLSSTRDLTPMSSVCMYGSIYGVYSNTFTHQCTDRYVFLGVVSLL